MNRLDRLAEAIMWREGWKPGTRSYRNANPGNMRWSKFAIRRDDEGYAVFDTFSQGWDALVWDLTRKCLGNTSTNLTPKSTIRDLIAVWAPTEDSNDPESYVVQACHRAGLNPDDALESLLGG